MHPNPSFRRETAERHLKFARQRAFGVLTCNGPDRPLLSHVPFLLSDDGATADLHLLRSNPIARAGGGPAVIAVSGPDGYVSPDWYRAADQVPTWNYVAVHLSGDLSPLPDDSLLDMLDRQSAFFEGRLAPKSPWTTGKMTPDVLNRMMRAIQPFRLHIAEVDGTWKLNQNKDPEVRQSAAGNITEGFGQELAALLELMKNV